ncbi:MAG: glucose-6-phosphate dehydrogenase [Planctomycetaceae bacterium]|jgi:glucose-6-phosphate 1-dehydrogenase|nr:glucose-6-phosphate dehydrogenase [Planctomycetaceae bacterium]
MNTLIIFGASGDLTSRKLIPSLYRLFVKGRLPQPFVIVGFSRTAKTDTEWQSELRATTKQFAAKSFDSSQWDKFAAMIHYHIGDIGSPESFTSLETRLRELESGESNRLYYLSTAPKFYEQTIQQLGKAGMATESPTDSATASRRVVIEKPFGIDLQSAQKLNESIHHVFTENQIYRIDHYLGKETVNNILVLRFANTIFEPIWNRNYIDHIQITANEEVTVGHRAAFYETAGVLRDMFQNHLLQILTFVTMEAPSRFDAKAVRDEKVKVLQAIRPMSPDQIQRDTLRGQYRSYRDEEGVAKGSRTATFAAMKLQIDNWRWKDVPIFLRSGKAMGCRTTQILVQFRRPPHSMFGADNAAHDANQLLLQIQPAEGIQIHFQTKVPDTEMRMRMTELKFSFQNSFSGEMPEAYERLLLDALQGDASLFARSDEVEAAWTIIDPIQTKWEQDKKDPELYETGSWGPPVSNDWIQKHERQWFDMCPLIGH